MVVALTGPWLAHFYDTTVGTCTAQHDCGAVTSDFLSHVPFLQSKVGLLLRVARHLRRHSQHRADGRRYGVLGVPGAAIGVRTMTGIGCKKAAVTTSRPAPAL